MSQSPLGGYQREAWLASFLALVPGHMTTMPLPDAQLQSLSPLALAYIGDAVYELFVRSHYLVPPTRIRTYHGNVVHHVRAEQQAHYLQLLKPYLTEAEADITRRGRNAASSRKQRANTYDYQQATGLEALIGYLYLTNPQRLLEILSYLPLAQQES
ncbi:MAG: ribonuclease III domain-containing protein [Cyanobacteria bacterium P01_F01_bin.86]